MIPEALLLKRDPHRVLLIMRQYAGKVFCSISDNPYKYAQFLLQILFGFVACVSSKYDSMIFFVSIENLVLGGFCFN